MTVPSPSLGGSPGAPTDQLRWWAAGEAHVAAAVGRVADGALAEPSLLPGWSRGTLLGHVASNADALVNLLAWARTGVETPMYASPEARAAGIAATAALAPPALRAAVRASAERLAQAVAGLPADAWPVEVRTAQGRTVPVREVVWMRNREVWVHAVDLDAGARFADVPDGVLVGLIDDATGLWERRGDPLQATLVSTGEGGPWSPGGSATAATAARTPALDIPVVTGSPADLARWVTGRGVAAALAGQVDRVALPPWL